MDIAGGFGARALADLDSQSIVKVSLRLLMALLMVAVTLLALALLVWKMVSPRSLFGEIGLDVFTVVVIGSAALVTGSASVASEWLQRSLLQPSGISSKRLGSRMLSITGFFYSARTVNETFHPLIADWRTEIKELLDRGQVREARHKSWEYRWCFVKAMGLSKVYSKAVGLFFSSDRFD